MSIVDSQITVWGYGSCSKDQRKAKFKPVYMSTKLKTGQARGDPHRKTPQAQDPLRPYAMDVDDCDRRDRRTGQGDRHRGV